ncbi:MAG: hypothetical protein ACI8XB_001809 [Patiriisocius sp.]|jgi:hypothetical protein
MKFAAIIPLLCLFVYDFYSQDLIITVEGDTINCAITYRNKNKIYYTSNVNKIYKSTSIRKKNIQKYEVSYYRDSITGEFDIVNIPEIQQFRAAFSLGYGRAALINFSDVVDFAKFERDLQKGIQFSGDFTYFFTEFSGFGVVVSRFQPPESKNYLNIQYMARNYINVTAKDKMSVTFIAPSYTTRSVSYDNHRTVFLNLAIGYLRFKDEFEFLEKSTMTGNSLGLRGNFGFDQQLSEHLQIGIESSYLLGATGRVKLANDGKFNSIESSALRPIRLGRFDASIGLRYYW